MKVNNIMFGIYLFFQLEKKHKLKIIKGNNDFVRDKISLHLGWGGFKYYN